jgi:transcription elongation factor Elf1
MKRRAKKSAAAAHPGLETCPHCASDFVQPVSWEPVGEERWWMFLRCAECGMSREVLVTNAEADRFEAELHARASILSRAAQKLEGERIEAEAAVFFAALDRDLIDAADFSR